MYAIFHSKHNVCNFLLWVGWGGGGAGKVQGLKGHTQIEEPKKKKKTKTKQT